MSDQISIPSVLMRGGTSSGPFFHLKDLPADRDDMSKVLLSVMGSPDSRQIDGIGGATPLTSKVCIISPSEREDSDIDYLFAQVSVDEAFVDYGPTCGNMLSGVGPFAIHEGLIPAQGETTTVRIHAVNNGGLIEAVVQTPGGEVAYHGDYAISGAPGTGAPILLKFLDLVGGATGSLFPAGDPIIEVEGVEVTCIDVAMPMVLARAQDMGIRGDETSDDLTANTELMERLETIRLAASYKMGLGDARGKVMPKFGILSSPSDGGNIRSRYFTPLTCHEAHAVTGTMCISSASLLPSTIASEFVQVDHSGDQTIWIEHPLGKIDCAVEVFCEDGLNNTGIRSCGVYRTARRLMDGSVYVPAGIY